MQLILHKCINLSLGQRESKLQVPEVKIDINGFRKQVKSNRKGDHENL